MTYCLCQHVAVLTLQTETADMLQAALGNQAARDAAVKRGKSLGFATRETGTEIVHEAD